MFKNHTSIIEKLIMRKKLLTLLSYIGIFILNAAVYFLIKNVEGNFTEAIIYYIFMLMFVAVSVVTAHFIPNDRKDTLTFFKIGMLAYSLYNMIFEIVIIAVRTAGGDLANSNTILVLLNIITYSRVVIPLGLVIWQAKKWTFLTGIRKRKQDAISYYKHNGNNGMK